MKKGEINMSKTKIKRKKNQNTKMIDLSDRKYIEIEEISEKDQKNVDDEYDKIFKEVNKMISKSMDDFLNNMETMIERNFSRKTSYQYKLEEIDFLLKEYDSLIKKMERDEELIERVNEYYKPFLHINKLSR